MRLVACMFFPYHWSGSIIGFLGKLSRAMMSGRGSASLCGFLHRYNLSSAGLTCALWPATTWPAKVGSMNDTPTQHGLPPELDRIAHERRARLIAQLHRQAMATANDLAVRQTAIKADIAKDARRRKTVAWMSIAGAFIVVLGSILALLAMTE